MEDNKIYLTMEQIFEARKVRKWAAQFRLDQRMKAISRIHSNYAQDLIDQVSK